MAARDRTLETFRERLARLDARLVELYAERRRLVGELMRHKARVGLARFDTVQEEKVVARARQRASEVGGHPQDAAELMLWVLAQVHRDTVPAAKRGPNGAREAPGSADDEPAASSRLPELASSSSP